MTWLSPLVVAAVISSVPAQPAESGKRKELVRVSVVPHDDVVKPGETTQLGIVLDVAKDWHVYWPGQNDTGMLTTVELTFPAGSGFSAGAVSFPLPKRHVEDGGLSLNYILEKKVVLTVPVKVPASAAPGSRIDIGAKVSYLVCNTACQPGEADVRTSFTIGAKTEENGPNAKLIDDARAAQPKTQADGFDAAATAKWEVGHSTDAENPSAPRTLVIEAKDAAATEMTFYAADGSARLLDPIKTGQVKGKALRLTFENGKKPVDGVVEIKSGNTSKAWTFHMPAATPASGGGAPAKPSGEALPAR